MIKPFSFDIDTCKEVLEDWQVRIIETKAREDAKKGTYDAPLSDHLSYWDLVQANMRSIVYFTQYKKTIERIKRMAND